MADLTRVPFERLFTGGDGAVESVNGYDGVVALVISDIIPSSTWAARGSGTTVGERKYISDLVTNRLVEVQWDSAYWRVCARTVVVLNTTLSTGIDSAGTEQILMQALLPVGLLRLGRTWNLKTLYGKNATSDTTTGRWRLGTAGTTADAVLLLNTISMTTTTRVFAREAEFYAQSATVLSTLGTTTTALQSWNSATSSTTNGTADTTVPDIDANALYLSASCSSAATAIPSMHQMVLEAIP